MVITLIIVIKATVITVPVRLAMPRLNTRLRHLSASHILLKTILLGHFSAHRDSETKKDRKKERKREIKKET